MEILTVISQIDHEEPIFDPSGQDLAVYSGEQCNIILEKLSESRYYD